MNKLSVVSIIFIMILANSNIGFCQDSTLININLSDGFVSNENLLLIIENDRGIQDTLSTGFLTRMGDDDVNLFTKKIKKNIVYTIILICESRGVQADLVCKIQNQLYIDFSISLRNEIQTMVSDSMLLYD